MSAPVTTLVTRVHDWARRCPDRTALRVKRLGIWQSISWGAYADTVDVVAHAWLSLGIGTGDRVAIQSENRPEWLVADLAAVAVRAATVGLYPTNPSAEVSYLLQDSGSRILVSEDEEQVDKVLAAEAECPDLEWIVYLDPRGLAGRSHPKLLGWDELLDRGRAHRRDDPEALERIAAEAQPDDLVALVYTSGTTGPPKGAMLTNRNVDFAIRTITGGGGFEPPPRPDDVVVSYLPLCHVAERVLTTWTSAGAGLVVHFAESIDTVLSDLREVQPSLFFAVPRIWEKIKAGIEIRMLSASHLKRLNYALWMRVGRRIGQSMIDNGGAHTVVSRALYSLGYVFLYRSLRDKIGLRNVRAAGSGAAPISVDVLRFFLSIGIPVHEIYGMTENSGMATRIRPGRVVLGTVGEPAPGVQVRIDESTGEILTRHAGVFAGYWGKPEATAEALDAEGWLRTGDVGEWVGGTHLKVIDRIKDIIITAGGKNISPSEIENALKASAFIREAVVIGDARPYLTALIGIEEDTVSAWAQRRALPYTTYRDLTEKEPVLRLVQGVIAEANQRFARVEQIREFRMLAKPLEQEDGELTATQKVRRAAMTSAYARLIDDMYEGFNALPGGDLVNVIVPAREPAS